MREVFEYTELLGEGGKALNMGTSRIEEERGKGQSFAFYFQLGARSANQYERYEEVFRSTLQPKGETNALEGEGRKIRARG